MKTSSINIKKLIKKKCKTWKEGWGKIDKKLIYKQTTDRQWQGKWFWRIKKNRYPRVLLDN